MKTSSTTNSLGFGGIAPDPSRLNEFVNSPVKATDEFKHLLEHVHIPGLDDFLMQLILPAGKKNFLVFKNNKYFNVLTENIAFFHVKYESSMITCFDNQEFFVNYSLDHIQKLLPGKQFYRLNRQYLINFNAIKEVEHFFARKLLVNLVIPIKDRLLVSKEKVGDFLHWLDNR